MLLTHRSGWYVFKVPSPHPTDARRILQLRFLSSTSDDSYTLVLTRMPSFDDIVDQLEIEHDYDKNLWKEDPEPKYEVAPKWLRDGDTDWCDEPECLVREFADEIKGFLTELKVRSMW